MSSLLPDVDKSPAPAVGETALLSKRVHAVQQVTEMASAGAAKLLGHARQMQTTLEQLTREFKSLPDAAQVNLLKEQMGSMQAMLDWLTTRSAPDGNGDFSGVQTRLSMSRVELAEIQAEILQAAAVARRMRGTRETLSGLFDGIETLESTQGKAEALLLEAKELSAKLERGTEAPKDIGGSG
jgi:uncharacterized phage infection (PIP) family protein YhgE